MKKSCSEILELVPEEEVEHEIEQADVFKEKVQRALIDARNAIETQSKTTDLIPATSLTDSLPPLLPSPPSSHATMVKLPRLSLKKFAEDLTKWAYFGILLNHL